MFCDKVLIKREKKQNIDQRRLNYRRRNKGSFSIQHIVSHKACSASDELGRGAHLRRLCGISHSTCPGIECCHDGAEKLAIPRVKLQSINVAKLHGIATPASKSSQ